MTPPTLSEKVTLTNDTVIAIKTALDIHLPVITKRLDDHAKRIRYLEISVLGTFTACGYLLHSVARKLGIL